MGEARRGLSRAIPGLGLAIVKHLVIGMSGDVDVESGSTGTRFSVRLPAA